LAIVRGEARKYFGSGEEEDQNCIGFQNEKLAIRGPKESPPWAGRETQKTYCIGNPVCVGEYGSRRGEGMTNLRAHKSQKGAKKRKTTTTRPGAVSGLSTPKEEGT